MTTTLDQQSEVLDATFVSHRGIFVADSGTPEWHAARAVAIGASEAAGACGLSRWTTAYEIYLRKLGLLPEIEDNDAMWWGRELEKPIGKKFCLETGKEVLKYPMPMLRHEHHEFMTATPDFLLTEPELLEAKSKLSYGTSEWGDEETDEIPIGYVLQCQQQMAVTGLDVCHLAALMPGPKLKKYRVDRNDNLIAQIIKKEAELWQRIQNHEPPEPDWGHQSTIPLLKKIHGDTTGETIILPATMAEVRRERDRLAEQIKKLEAEQKALEAKMLAAIGDNAVALFEADENGYPCEFQLNRSWRAPTRVEAYDKKGYFTITKSKVKA